MQRKNITQTSARISGIIELKGVRKMDLKGLAISMGIGAAAGAVAIMMMPKNNPTRKLAAKAANKVEEAAWKVSDKITHEFDL